MASMTGAVLAVLAATALTGATSNDVSGVTVYKVPLSGVAESNFAHPAGGTGDLNGAGMVELKIDPAKKQVCCDFKLSGLSTPLMAHIHQGPPLSNGPPVITLFTGPGAPLDGCVTWLRGPLAEIVANPSSFYVNIETTEYPDGALRGQI